MKSKTKLFLAVAIAVLALIIALIVLQSTQSTDEQATPQPQTTEQTVGTDALGTDAPQAADGTEEQPQTSPQSDETPQPNDEDLYEGALAGMTEEEIGALAMAEEGAHLDDDTDGSVD